MTTNRREFLKNAGMLAIGPAIIGSVPFLSGCVKNGVSPIEVYHIDGEACIGCGRCLEACVFETISLPKRTVYNINTEKCIQCGQCIPFCEYKAFDISIYYYDIISDKCVGCGKCIEKCKPEGDAISYEREDYTIKGKCRPDMCDKNCIAACPEGAITLSDDGERAIINLAKCTRCGLCVAPCPRDAVNPAKAIKDENKCIHCGKCYEVCSFEAVSRELPDGDKIPSIIQELCTSCGKCMEACPKIEAIEWELYKASIMKPHCRECGDCYDACEFDAIYYES